MKKILPALFMAIIVTASASAASFNIDEDKDVSLSGIDKIIFELNEPSCALCINTGKHSYSLNGGGRREQMSLSLEGDLRSNNRKAVPSLIIDKSGTTLTVRLYREKNLFFGLVQRGSVHFNAELPDYFNGDIDVMTSSGDTAVYSLNLKGFSLTSSSGDIETDNIEAENISVEASSGDITAGSLIAVKKIRMHSSSGDIEIKDLLSEAAGIDASSGRIVLGKIRATKELSLDASSGRIIADYLECDSASIHTSSGRITVSELVSNKAAIDASSGDITLGSLKSGRTEVEASSGKTTIDIVELTDDFNIRSSSGDVKIALPAGTGFEVDLKASSGKIRSDFRLLGEVNTDDEDHIVGEANGGGPSIRVKASSGDISIEER